MAWVEKLLAPLLGIAIEKWVDMLPALIKKIKAGDAKPEGPVLDYLKQNEKTSKEAEQIVETAEAETIWYLQWSIPSFRWTIWI